MKYYYLKEGEVIKEGDEVEISNSMKDPAKWVKASSTTIGTKAPNPSFPAHRKYRRLICGHHPFDRSCDDFGNVICDNCGDIVSYYGTEY